MRKMTAEESAGQRGWMAGTMLGVLLGMSMICFFIWFEGRYPRTIEKTEIQVMYDLNDPYTEEKVKNYLKELHVKYPKIALSQMKLESSNGTSKIFRENNNLFGMKLAVRRPTTALGERNNHAYYSHWRQSCVDYALYQAFVSNTENLASEEAWLDYVGRVYAQDDSYKKKLRVIRESLDKK